MRATSRAEATARIPIEAMSIEAPSLESIIARLPRDLVQESWFERAVIPHPLRLRAIFHRAASIEALADRIQDYGAEVRIDLCRCSYLQGKNLERVSLLAVHPSGATRTLAARLSESDGNVVMHVEDVTTLLDPGKEEVDLPPAGGMENTIDIVALEAPERWYEQPRTLVEQVRF